MKTILGTGPLGLAVLEVLLKYNPKEKIILVNRTGEIDITIPSNVTLLSGEVTNKIDMEGVARKSKLIFSCIDESCQNAEDFYPAMASSLAYALKKTSAYLIFADNLYSYCNVKGQEMDEDMPHKAKTKKGLISASLINTLLKTENEFNNRVAFIKSANFLGPRNYKGIFGKDFLDKLHTEKRIFFYCKTVFPHTFTYVNDCAIAMINIANTSDAFGQIWHVPNAEAIDLKKWIHLFEEETNKKARIIFMPKVFSWIAGYFNSRIKEDLELSYQFEHPFLVNHEKYLTRFGNHSTDPAIIVQETIQWYRNAQKNKFSLNNLPLDHSFYHRNENKKWKN
ncbi:MAG: hypothetical protein ABWY22_08945 [Flavobacterium sp.]